VASPWAACSANTRYRVLSTFFDGVPPPAGETVETTEVGAVEDSTGRAVGLVEHEPYAERACDLCHDSSATNALVVPAERLCFECHDFDLDRPYVHGPLAAGGCLVCHDPHSSPYRYLLVSASDGFCLHCHDQATLRDVDGHQRDRVDCTTCHEAHMADRPHLLR